MNNVGILHHENRHLKCRKFQLGVTSNLKVSRGELKAILCLRVKTMIKYTVSYKVASRF